VTRDAPRAKITTTRGLDAPAREIFSRARDEKPDREPETRARARAGVREGVVNPTTMGVIE